MGSWDIKLFANDISRDIQNTYISFLRQQLSDEEAFKRTYLEYIEIMGTNEEALFWYALAYCQWKCGRLGIEVKSKALDFIDRKGELSQFDGNKKAKWIKELNDLEQLLSSPMPLRKTFRKPVAFVRNPWNIGDMYAYRFHTAAAEKYGMENQYIVFQKIGDVSFYEEYVFSAIQVYDRVFERVPTASELRNVRILPLVDPCVGEGNSEHMDAYIPSFGWYLKAMLFLEKRAHYPKKHLTFIGNQTISAQKFNAGDLSNMFWEKNGMDEWLCRYYTLWRNVAYERKN